MIWPIQQSQCASAERERERERAHLEGGGVRLGPAKAGHKIKRKTLIKINVEFINYIRGDITAQSVRDSTLSSSKFKTVHDVFKAYRDNELCQRQTIAGRTHALEVSYECHIKKKIGVFQFPVILILIGV